MDKVDSIFFKVLLQKTPSHIYFKDTKGKYLHCSDSQAINQGFKSGAEVVGKTEYDLLSYDVAKQVMEIDKCILESGTTKTFEEHVTFPSGKKSVYLSSKTPVYDEKHKPMGIVGISMDITKHREAEQLAQKTARLEQEKLALEKQLTSAKSVIATIAHEMRTPLAAVNINMQGIKPYVDEVIHDYQLVSEKDNTLTKMPKEELEMLEASFESTTKSLKLAHQVINSLLENVGYEGIEIFDLESIDIIESIKEALEGFVFTHGNKELVNINDEYTFKFKGKKHLFIQIIYNLLKNALYFIASIGKGKVYIYCSEELNYNVLYFKDTSVGIQKEDLPHIFKDFYTKNTNHGTGIGLAFCKKVMEDHGGKIECVSEFGKYTEFCLYFPKVED